MTTVPDTSVNAVYSAGCERRSVTTIPAAIGVARSCRTAAHEANSVRARRAVSAGARVPIRHVKMHEWSKGGSSAQW